MATVTLKQIQKTYPNGNRTLHGIDLDIEDGELIVVVGPSGCGKSTLLRCVAGLETISAGELYIDSDKVNDREPANRNIAMVFQNYALYPHMSVADNMGYALKNLKVAKSTRDIRIQQAAKLLGIENLLERKPGQLSGGQRQRVAMGRAIVREPKVFLFDEPLSNLDAALRVQMRLEIRRLQKRLKTTAMYVTHDQVEAMTLADRLVVMNGGYIEQVGTPIDLYTNPQTRFVAGFIGSPSMNFINAKVSDGKVAFSNNHTLSLEADSVDGDIVVGVRPEHIRTVNLDDADVTVSVEMIEPLGADTLVYCSLAGQESPLVVRLEGEAKVADGDTLGLQFPTHYIHLFNAEDGKRVACQKLETA